jgi:hypothetical protein
MTDVDSKCGCTVRVVVRLRPDEYDELVRHTREIGSTMSAFLRESAARVIKQGASSPILHAQQTGVRRVAAADPTKKVNVR